jgi:hypothetical protein
MTFASGNMGQIRRGVSHRGNYCVCRHCLSRMNVHVMYGEMGGNEMDVLNTDVHSG